MRDVRPLLAEADGYLLTSRYEGLPIGALEAYEAGLPLILSRFDGAEDLVAAHPLALVLDLVDPAADAQQIGDLLDRAAAGGDDVRQAVQAAWAKRWSFDVFAENAMAAATQLTELELYTRALAQSVFANRAAARGA